MIAVLIAPTPPTSAQSSDPAAPFDSAQGRPAAGRDTVVIGFWDEPDTLFGLFASANVSFAIHPVIFTIDAEWDDAWKLFPQGVEYLPNVRDGTWKVNGERMTLSWKLKPRNWHDGRPVTCGDYVFTHNLIRNARQLLFDPGPIAPRIANVSCPNGATGRDILVTYNERVAGAHQFVLGVPGRLPRHILEPYYRANPGRLSEAPFGRDPAATIGDGPYRLAEWRKGQSLAVESVLNHAIFGTPKIKRITWRFMPPAALVTQILAGSIDVISSTGIDLAQAVQLERQGAGRVRVFFEPSMIWEHIDFNLDNPLLQDVRVRRAIAHAINRTQIVQQVFLGKHQISHTYFPPRHPGYTNAVQKYPHDPARSRRLLEEAGFRPGPDGVLQTATGERFELQFSTTPAPLRIRAQQIIQQQLRQVGIETRTLNFPGPILFDQTARRRRFGLLMYAWVRTPLDGCFELYTSAHIPAEQNGWRGQNYPGYHNSTMDEICYAANREVDDLRRNEHLKESAQIFSRDLPALPLWDRVDVAAAKVGLKNFRPVRLAFTFETWNAHQWYWE